MIDSDHTVPSFESDGWYDVAGRGRVVTVRNPGGYPEPNVLRGTSVLVDGKPFLVRGVESHLIGRPYPDHLNFALLVDEGWSVDTRSAT